MTHITVVKVSQQNRVEKFQDYATKSEADAHVARVLPAYPQAFAATRPVGSPSNWLVDLVAKTLVLSPALPSPADVRSAALAQIATIESKQGRALREASIGTVGAVDRLKVLDAQIVALRAKLV